MDLPLRVPPLQQQILLESVGVLHLNIYKHGPVLNVAKHDTVNGYKRILSLIFKTGTI